MLIDAYNDVLLKPPYGWKHSSTAKSAELPMAWCLEMISSLQCCKKSEWQNLFLSGQECRDKCLLNNAANTQGRKWALNYYYYLVESTSS